MSLTKCPVTRRSEPPGAYLLWMELTGSSLARATESEDLGEKEKMHDLVAFAKLPLAP